MTGVPVGGTGEEYAGGVEGVDRMTKEIIQASDSIRCRIKIYPRLFVIPEGVGSVATVRPSGTHSVPPKVPEWVPDSRIPLRSMRLPG